MWKSARTFSLIFMSSLACGGAFAASPRAQAASQCESLKDDNAYNRCLASMGPHKRGAKHTTDPRTADPETDAKALSGKASGEKAPAKTGQAPRNDSFLNAPLRR